MDSLPDPLLIDVLRRVSVSCGGFAVALVCKRWWSLAPQAQAAVTVRRDAGLVDSQLVSVLSRFPILTDLHLERGSFSATASLFMDASLMDTLQQHCPNLETLRLPKLVRTLSLPEDLTPFRNLRVLELNDWSWDYRHSFGPDLSALPASLASLASLRQLSLRSLQVETLPDDVTCLTLLRVLCLDFWNLRTLPAGIGSLRHLSTFMLSSGRLLELPRSFVQLNSLSNLHLNCVLLSELPSNMDSLSALASLEISNCWALGSLPEAVARIPSLTSLEAGACLQSLVSHREALLRLRSLRIDYFPGEELPAGLFATRCLSQLELLSLTHCSRVTSLPDDLASLAGCLHQLHVDSLEGLAELPPTLGHFSSLTELHLSYLPCLRSLPNSISCLTHLKVLRLYTCGLVCLPPDMEQMVSLATLEIKDCQALRTLPDSIGELPSLQELWLHDLPMLESIPQAFGSLVGLTRLVILSCAGLRGALNAEVVSRLRQQMPSGAFVALDATFLEGF